MQWADFAAALADAHRREGYTVNRLDGLAADFELVKAGRTTLLAAKRWKAARTGIEPLRDLHELRRKREAYDCAYVCAGELTDQARKFATDHNVRLLEGADLAMRLKGSLPRA
jgi:restriction system protein